MVILSLDLDEGVIRVRVRVTRVLGGWAPW